MSEKSKKKISFLYIIFMFIIVILFLLFLIGRKINRETGLNYQDIQGKREVDILVK